MKIYKRFISWYFSKNALPYWCVLLLDCLIVLLSGYIGTYLEDGGSIIAGQFWLMTRGLCVTVFIYAIAFRLFHTYSGVVRYSSFVDLQRVSGATIVASLATSLVSWVVGTSSAIIMPSFLTITTIFVLATFLMGMERVIVKRLYDVTIKATTTKRAFIYGVKDGGVSIAKSIQGQVPQQFSVVGFVSPDGDLEEKYLMGVKVRKDGPNLLQHMKEEGANVMIVSPLQTTHFREREELINELVEAGIRIMMMPEAEVWDGKSSLSHQQFQEVDIEDLLPRDKIEVDMEAIGAMLKGKRVLITGATGSIGSEMVRQIAPYKPSDLVLVDQAETPMHDVRLWASRFQKASGVSEDEMSIETIVTSITDQTHMEKIFSDHRPQYVFHAAAYKHVPMMEDNPAQAVRNNIYGTRVIADLAVKYGTKKFVMISTDKAVNPTNVMGCSKRICEIYCQSLNQAIQNKTIQNDPNFHDIPNPSTQFVTTRFGNVLGSNGSVIPIFRDQIKKGGPVTVTHPDIIRYFMLIPEACKLVLEAGTMGRGGEIFVFDMGKPVRIVDLAKRMIKLSGVKDVEIKFTGLRDGEKLYEEVLADEEDTKPTVHPKIKVASVREYPYDEALKNEKELYDISFSHDDMAIVKKMKEIVPEYKSRQSKYEVLDK